MKFVLSVLVVGAALLSVQADAGVTRSKVVNKKAATEKKAEELPQKVDVVESAGKNLQVNRQKSKSKTVSKPVRNRIKPFRLFGRRSLGCTG
ncbi:MAG: hypothetical protein ACO23H_03080 [Alphaproteobacteria bacterium]